MKWFCLDSETNILNRGDGAVGEQQAHPASELNKIVSYGEQWAEGGKVQYKDVYSSTGVKDMPEFLKMASQGQDVLLAMHNVPFDWSYLIKTWPEEMMAALPHIFAWDTMQVEFLLQGQDKVMPSLDWCAVLYDLPLKDDKIKEYWKQGVDTAFIPKGELLEYQKQDVDNTRRLFLEQWNAVSQSPKLLELVRIKMDDKLFTTFMQIYGMHFDLTTAAELLGEVDAETAEVYTTIMAGASEHFAEDFTFNPSSPDQVSVLMFGGDYKVERVLPVFGEDGQQVVYKSGARKGEGKTKKTIVVEHTKGLGMNPRGIPEAKGGYSTSDEHLSKLKTPLAELILKYRGLKKDAETYYRGYASLVWPDGCIRPNQQHEVAGTGRMSCSAPNLQNVSKEDED